MKKLLLLVLCCLLAGSVFAQPKPQEARAFFKKMEQSLNMFDTKSGIEKETIQAIKDYLAAGGKIDDRDPYDEGRTALHKAVSAQNITRINVLMSYNANPYIQSDYNGDTPKQEAEEQLKKYTFQDVVSSLEVDEPPIVSLQRNVVSTIETYEKKFDAKISDLVKTEQKLSDENVFFLTEYLKNSPPEDKDLATSIKTILLKNYVNKEPVIVVKSSVDIKVAFLKDNSIIVNFGESVDKKILETVFSAKKMGRPEFDVLFKTDILPSIIASYKANKDPYVCELYLLIAEGILQKYISYGNTPVDPTLTTPELELRSDISTIAINYSDNDHSVVKELKDIVKKIYLDDLGLDEPEVKRLKETYNDLGQVKIEAE